MNENQFARLRQDFPILQTKMNDRPLVYLDSAASTQKPARVIDGMKAFYENDYANIHRGIYDLSQRATAMHDEVRHKVQRYLNAASWRELVFLRNATEGVNLVAQCFLKAKLEKGDEILVTEMEHHANIVPWQMIAAEKGAKVIAAPITDDGELDLDAFYGLINERTKMIGIAWVSNVLGTVNPVHEIVAEAKKRGIPILIDAAQAVQHMKVDVQELDADFLVFSGHKIYGPSGTGVLHAKAEHLEAMPPYQGGGDMIEKVSFDGTTWNEIPFKFEAGTPDIAGFVGLGYAIDYVSEIGVEAIEEHEAHLLAYATRAIAQIPGLRLIGTAANKCSVLTFAMDSAHPQDIGTMLDLDGVAIRTGHHCAMPLHSRLGLPASARASFGLYNNEEDVDTFVASLRRVSEIFG